MGVAWSLVLLGWVELHSEPWLRVQNRERLTSLG